MKNNSVFILNINNVWCNNCRESVYDACKRWDCDCYEQTENLVGDQDC